MTWPVSLSINTCLLPVATRFGELLLNGRRLFAGWMDAAADGDSNWWRDEPVVDENVARLNAGWKLLTVLLGGLKRLASGEAATDIHEGWELSNRGTETADAGRTAWLRVEVASAARGRTRNTCNGGWLETTTGSETTITGDAVRLVEPLLPGRGNSDRYVVDVFSVDPPGISDTLVLTASSTVFFLAISSSNYSKPYTWQQQHEVYQIQPSSIFRHKTNHFITTSFFVCLMFNSTFSTTRLYCSVC